MKNFLANTIAVLWFFAVILQTIVITGSVVIMLVFTYIPGMIKSGCAMLPVGFAFCFFTSIVFSVTGLVPVFRKCYYKLPWLYPLCMMLTMDLYILSIAESIIAQGYQTMNPTKHVIAVVLMIIQIIVCRIAMCIYMKKYPMVLKKYDRVQ